MFYEIFPAQSTRYSYEARKELKMFLMIKMRNYLLIIGLIKFKMMRQLSATQLKQSIFDMRQNIMQNKETLCN